MNLLDAVRQGGTGRTEIVAEGQDQRAYLAPPWKLIVHKFGRRELYNLEADPMEINDRSREQKEVLEALTDKLRRWMSRHLGNARHDPM